ncbi:SRT-53 protein, partial [Aphelenchoides avenae]
VMYVPCMMVLSRRLSQSCYKFMFYIGIVDVCTLCINALLTGYYTMRGYVYCDAPVAMYFAGCTGNDLLGK